MEAGIARPDADPDAPPVSPSLAVLVPTQELATQVIDVIHSLVPSLRGLVSLACGRLGPARRDPYHVVVATPAALRDNVKAQRLSELRTVVFDEADALLTGALAEPITSYLLPNFRHRFEGPQVLTVRPCGS